MNKETRSIKKYPCGCETHTIHPKFGKPFRVPVFCTGCREASVKAGQKILEKK